MSRPDLGALSLGVWESVEVPTRPSTSFVLGYPTKVGGVIHREMQPLYATLYDVVAEAAMQTADGWIPRVMLIDPGRRVGWR